MPEPLELFTSNTARWFEQTLGTPTAVQAAAWPSIATGRHTLLSAPTGTGKTLAAFLVFLDRMMTQALQGTLAQELQLIYVSPLKSLAGDIHENLRRPLDGLFHEVRQSGPVTAVTRAEPPITAAVRTGDTTQAERRRMLKSPPHILITTPESLYLLLTAVSGQKLLKTARYIILDELHALIDSKRGAHLMLSVARLDSLCPTPLQRIGLSATIEPLDTAAHYLSPDNPVIAAPKMHKAIALNIVSPFSGIAIPRKDPVWQELAEVIYHRTKELRCAIAFVEGRTQAEKLAYYVNLLGGEGYSRTHHGSMSKERRHEAEEALRQGTLKLLCATSSMELGIDVGDIDEVFQIGNPRSISGAMQRLGRAGHNPNRTSTMTFYPRAASEMLYSGLVAQVVRLGGIEQAKPPRLCLDVLAQHLVSMAATGSYTIDAVLAILERAYPFRQVTRDHIRKTLAMLAGDDEHRRDIPVRPRLLYDRIHETVTGDPYSKLLAVSAAGTIPDKGLFSVRSDTGVKLGELDEEFVFEARVGDKFLLGTFAWQIREIKRDAVVVIPATSGGARPPFWKGELKGRRRETGLAFGEIFRALSEAHETNTLLEALTALGLDNPAAKDAEDLVRRQLAVTGALPDDRTLIAEHFLDESGSHQLMIHSVFGQPINEPLGILLAETARRRQNAHISFVADDDGILLYPYDGRPLPEGLLQDLSAQTAEALLTAVLPSTPLFNMAFRYNAGRALMMGVRKAGRQPLWVQRIRSAEMLESLLPLENHPLIQETRRECLEDYWDLEGLKALLDSIGARLITVRECHTALPSPLSMPLRHRTEAAMMYDYAPTPRAIHAAVENALQQDAMLAPDEEQLAQAAQRRALPTDHMSLHTLLMIEGDLTAADEFDIPIGWLEALAQKEQAAYIEPGLWIAAEHLEDYKDALVTMEWEAQLRLVRRLLRYRGAQTPETVAARYLWSEDTARHILTALCNQEDAVLYQSLYYHTALFNRARRETLSARQKLIKTQAPEHYASLLAQRPFTTGAPQDRLTDALKDLQDLSFPAEVWESVLLPGRIPQYRPEQLDALLASGQFTWHVGEGKALAFHQQEALDWDQLTLNDSTQLTASEDTIVNTLRKTGAAFAHRLSSLPNGDSPYETLLGLTEKGLVTADSFLPIRQLLTQGTQKTTSLKRRVKARVMTITAGRWELTHPLKPTTVEDCLARLFARHIIVCRETAEDLGWSDALLVLRVWEYTGRVRRGYFVDGLSGAQYILDSAFNGVVSGLEHPTPHLVWLPAIDPAQPWGKCLKHREGRSFQNVPGTAVCLKNGAVAAVFERQGKTLRVFEHADLPAALEAFKGDFVRRRLFPHLSSVVVRQYPPEAADPLENAGLIREMQDFVLYRD